MIRFAAFVFAATVALAGTTYSYDSAGRLAKVDYGAGGSITYTYDNAGNVLSRTVQSAGSASTAKPDEKKPAAKQDQKAKKQQGHTDS